MELQFRKLALPVKKGIPSSLDLEGRSVEVVAATESPVTVFDYERFEPVDEVLLMAGLQLPESRQLPLLDAHSRHSTSNVIGSVRALKVAGGQLIGRAHFSSSPEVEPVWTRVREGHLTDFSIGYRVLESVWIPANQNQKIGNRTFSGPVRVSTAWEAKELSAVPIGADKDAKARSERNYQIMENNHIEVEEEHKRPRTLRREAEQQARAEIGEILALGEAHNLTSEASEAVRSGWTLEDFRGYLLEKTASKTQQFDDPGGIPARIGSPLGLTQRDQQQFSIIRLANAIASGQHDDAGHEFEVCRAHMKQTGKTFDGRRISIPFEALAMQKRDMSTFVDSSGGYMVANNLVGFVELLRNQSVVMTLGATVLSDLQGDVSIPKQTGAGTAYWVAEGGDLTESQQTLGQISLKPHTVGAYTDLTRRFRIQATPDGEQMVRNDLARVIGLAVDLAALNGSGAAGEPLGLLQTTGIGAKTLATANTVTHGELCDIETHVEVDNALGGNLAYTANSTIAGKMRQTDTATDSGRWVLEGEKTSNGYPFLMSNQVPSKYILFGNWSDMVLGMWSGLDINIDTASLSTSGGLRIVVMQDVDVALRHPESFAYGYKA